MTEFLLAALTFPAVVFTTLLGIVLGYWSLVTVGLFGPEALEGVADGVLEGAAEGTAALTAPRDDDDESKPGALAVRDQKRGFLAKYDLRRVPITVSFSLFTLFGWALTHGTSLMAGSILDGLVARGIWGSGVMLLAILFSLRLTSWAIIPIAPFFSGSQSLTNDEMIGQIARVQTIRVTRKVGQATLNTSGGSLNVTIRADESLALTKNDRVMLVSYDPELRAFEVTRIDDMLPSEAAPRP
ncbi:hypothetical protein [Enhygromyxa salina]|uniref:DUF1449 family protein n=1 Tax=Enhygromyxa salina TaxID=215803 RepID=A0A2S9YSN1_9BACT|nr:hypothetical protein [Enhygromyxa salina]PRQ08111.1 hypothetical protein ENSA7_20830 [Enhygromyxa salina]